MQSKHFNRAVELGVAGFFFIAVAIITYTLISEHQAIAWAYSLFPLALLIAYFSPRRKLKLVATWVSLLHYSVSWFFMANSGGTRPNCELLR